MKISVVIPAYNEEARIPQTLRVVAGYLAGNYDYEIIVVDDGSTDSTVKICSGFNVRVLKNDCNRGKGFSVRRGVMEAAGDFILFSDADMSTPIEELPKLMKAAGEGADIAAGSRGLPDSDVRVHQPFLRERMGKCFNLLVRLAAVPGIKDTQCGFKLFRRGCAAELFGKSRLDGFAFDVEILFLARKAGMRIEEVPVVWKNSPASRVKVLSDPLRMFMDIFYIRLLWLAGCYR